MAKNFSGPSNLVNVATVALDQAPGAPTLSDPFFDEAGAQFIPLVCPTTDFDGSPLTPNGSGSSGCDNAYICIAQYNEDGTLKSGAEHVAGFLISTLPASPGASLNMPVTGLPALPGGGSIQVVGFVSDGQD